MLFYSRHLCSTLWPRGQMTLAAGQCNRQQPLDREGQSTSSRLQRLRPRTYRNNVTSSSPPYPSFVQLDYPSLSTAHGIAFELFDELFSSVISIRSDFS